MSESPQDSYSTSVGSYSVITKDLDRFNLKGRFMMFKVEIETSYSSSYPIVGEFVVSYSSKHSVFFFTRKIKVDKGTNIDNIIVTATYSEPSNTEVKFGIVGSNSSNWEDYTIISQDQLKSLPSAWGNAVKIGVKMSSYSDVRYPVVQQIALLVGANSDNEINLQ
jgi:hypothetical protein